MHIRPYVREVLTEARRSKQTELRTQRSLAPWATSESAAAEFAARIATLEQHVRELDDAIETLCYAKPRSHEQAASALGRKGGSRGGAARAEKLTPERRSEIAQKAARKRWGPKPA